MNGLNFRLTIVAMLSVLGASALMLSILTGSLWELLVWMGPTNVLLVGGSLGLLLILWGRHLIRTASANPK